MTPRQRRLIMYLGYIDDSGFTGRNLEDCQSRFQVVGSPAIPEGTYAATEAVLRSCIERVVPEESWENFEY